MENIESYTDEELRSLAIMLRQVMTARDREISELQAAQKIDNANHSAIMQEIDRRDRAKAKVTICKPRQKGQRKPKSPLEALEKMGFTKEMARQMLELARQQMG